jgi:hypothetical protein
LGVSSLLLIRHCASGTPKWHLPQQRAHMQTPSDNLPPCGRCCCSLSGQEGTAGYTACSDTGCWLGTDCRRHRSCLNQRRRSACTSTMLQPWQHIRH